MLLHTNLLHFFDFLVSYCSSVSCAIFPIEEWHKNFEHKYTVSSFVHGQPTDRCLSDAPDIQLHCETLVCNDDIVRVCLHMEDKAMYL